LSQIRLTTNHSSDI